MTFIFSVKNLAIYCSYFHEMSNCFADSVQVAALMKSNRKMF